MVTFRPKSYYACGNLKKNLGNKNMSMIAPFPNDCPAKNVSKTSFSPSRLSQFDTRIAVREA